MTEGITSPRWLTTSYESKAGGRSERGLRILWGLVECLGFGFGSWTCGTQPGQTHVHHTVHHVVSSSNHEKHYVVQEDLSVGITIQ